MLSQNSAFLLENEPVLGSTVYCKEQQLFLKQPPPSLPTPPGYLVEQLPAMFGHHGHCLDDVIHCLLAHKVGKTEPGHPWPGKNTKYTNSTLMIRMGLQIPCLLSKHGIIHTNRQMPYYNPYFVNSLSQSVQPSMTMSRARSSEMSSKTWYFCGSSNEC